MLLGAAVLLNLIDHIGHNLYANHNTTENTFVINLSLQMGDELIKHDNQSMTVYLLCSLPCYPTGQKCSYYRSYSHHISTVQLVIIFHCIVLDILNIRKISQIEVVTLSGHLFYGMHICMMTCSVKFTDMHAS